jgi:hypothetical protein
LINEGIAITVYPNPASDWIMVESNTPISTIGIYDISGRNVNSYKYLQDQIISISHLPAGIYFISASTDKGQIINKIIKK